MSNGWRNVLCRGRRSREGGEERKEGEVAYSASSAVLDKKNIFFAPSQQKHFLTSWSLCCCFWLFFFFFPQQKQLSKRHWKMWVLVKGMYLTFCLRASCWFCYQSTQAPSWGMLLCRGWASLTQSTIAQSRRRARGTKQHEPAAKQSSGGLAAGALMCRMPVMGAWFKPNP